MILYNNNHSVFALKYRLILMTVNPITEVVSNRLIDIFKNISSNYNISISGWEYDKDEIKITLYAHPNSEISKFINAYKSASSRLIKKEFPSIVENHNKQFWTKTFGLYTLDTGINDILIIKKIRKG